MAKTNITVHMMVKNEDQWVRYSLLSILPYVDRILVTDTGSSDHTLDAIKSLASPKIKLTLTTVSSPGDVTRIRETQIKDTTTDWFWVVDGDEIYPDDTAKEVVKAINSGLYEGVTVRRYDLLGDIYHRQKESVGAYNMWGETGHLVLRALNQNKLKGLHMRGDYPNEGYYDAAGSAIISHDPRLHYVTSNYLYHAMYLKRSSLGGNLPMFNRSKFKIELGIPVPTNPPIVFNEPPLSWEGNPKKPRSTTYFAFASLITPIKNLKRKFL
ncbi:MAG: glycosyltransferase [Candidatus Moraniibacteriota bacterium]|nr:MAG: glycosyltransferase [Candidatus Moranbacteria bacterium]